MKKLLISAGTLVFIGALVVSATGAFFSDTETSTGNVFAAGDIDLQIDNESYVTNTAGVLVASPANSWDLSDLTNQLFFSFSDVKPGDIGEDTISIHVGSNDAYACMAADITATPENSLVEPETDDGDAGPANGDNGELQNYLNFVFWNDDGDNVYEVGESQITQLVGPASTIFNGSWAPIGTTSVLTGGATNYVAKAWCFGGLTPGEVPQDGLNTSGPLDGRGTGFTCNGSGDGDQNDAQTDGIVMDVSFYAVQARNNPNFTCAGLPTFNGEEPGVDVAASYQTGFEPPVAETFAVGDINGQGGWKKTGSYDAAVVNNPVISGLQSLRISNAVTSGSFGDQTISPSLATGAGETGVGSVKHFEAEFIASSTQVTQQPGLAISVSPDDGNGSRMSYLRFEDQADGIHVIFSEVTNPGPLPTASSFSSEDIATISRGPHTIKFVIDFVDGPSNDIVKIYIDGVLEKTGTTWENYYRFDSEQTGNGNLLFAVDSLIFPARGTAAPATSGNGFLFDIVSMLSGTI